MKILLINHFPLSGSGSGVYTTNIAKSLERRGHEVCIIYPDNINTNIDLNNIKLHPVYFKGEEIIEGQLDFNFPCFTTHPRSTTNFYDLTDEQVEKYINAFKKAIDEEIKEFNPDIIHGQHIWILSSLSKEYNIPLILTAHGTDLMGYQKSTRFHKYCNDAVEQAKTIITISKDSSKLVLESFPQSEEKIKMIRNGYDTKIFYPVQYNTTEILNEFGINGNYKHIVAFAGKMTRFKGVDVLLDAIKKYEKEDIVTILAGDGELYNQLTKQAKDLGLKNAYFIKNQPHVILRKLYNIAKVFVIPSRREPFGLVAIEALACGTPVVGTNQGGIPDFLKEDVGTLVEVENSDELAKAIEDILYDNKKFDTQYIANYAKENYSQDALIEELINVYKKAMET